MLANWKSRIKALEREIVAIAYAARDPRTPWAARLFVLAVVAYAVSPIDLIPDFIPVLGYLDDLLLLPVALMLARRMIPRGALEDARVRADERLPTSKTAAVIIMLIWVVAAVGTAYLLWPLLSGVGTPAP